MYTGFDNIKRNIENIMKRIEKQIKKIENKIENHKEITVKYIEDTWN